jgi:hypothetical protein
MKILELNQNSVAEGDSPLRRNPTSSPDAGTLAREILDLMLVISARKM